MRHTRQEIIGRTQREYEQLDALVRRLTPEDWDLRVPRPETRAPWTVKDALAHVVYWKAHTARVFRGERRPPELRRLEVPQINDVVYEQWRERPVQDVVAWHRKVHSDVMRTLEALPEEWFSRREHAPGWPGDFDGHSAAHRLKDIEAALSQTPPPQYRPA
jgi:hypothetical protein